MMILNNKQYDLVFLDTNVLREIVLNNHNIRNNFKQKFFTDSKCNIPCFSLYNVLEIKPYKDIYRKFLKFFSNMPCLLLYPYKLIVEQEYKSHINNRKFEFDNTVSYAFLPKQFCKKQNAKRFFRTIFKNKFLIEIIEENLDEFNSLAKTWQNQRGLQTLSTKKYFSSQEYSCIKGFLKSKT
jgi:hypothetical protein